MDPESVKGLCKLWDTDGRHLLHLCFDYCTEYDPDVVFDKMRFSQLFAQNVAFF